jgi:hypothetical protein
MPSKIEAKGNPRIGTGTTTVLVEPVVVMVSCSIQFGLLA